MFNNFQKKLVKLTAIFMAVSLVLGMFPVQVAYGFVQPGVRGLEISDAEGVYNSENSYAVNLSWKLWSSGEIFPEEDVDVLPLDNATNTGILVREKRLVPGVAAVDHLLNSKYDGVTEATINMEGAVRGSLYSFKIYPFHKHQTVKMVDGEETKGAPVNVYPPESSIEEVLYMTNLQVDAVGSVNAAGENCLTVTWDNPTYNGSTVIPNYRIYYTPVTDSTNVSTLSQFERQLSVSMSEAIPVADTSNSSIRRLRYTFSSEFLEQGKKYVVAVEPCDTAGNPYRTQAPKRMISINGKQTQIEFKRIEKGLYKSIAVGIPFTLGVEVYSDAYLRLAWPQVEAGDASVIVIYSSTDEKVWTEITRIYNTDRTYYLVPRPKTGTTFYKIGFYRNDSDIEIGVQPQPETSTPYPFYNASGLDITPSRPELNLGLASASTDSRIIINATWDAYVRAPLTPAEEQNSTGTITSGLRYVDKDVYYDIWLSDDLNSLLYSFESVPKIIDKGQFALNESTNTYSTTFDKYYDTTTQKLETIVSNKLYYARIVARRPSATALDGMKERWSEPGYATFYITVKGEIATPPMISKPPLQVARDAEGEKIITQTSITFTWREKWIELYDSKGTQEWYTSPIGKRGSTIVFGDAAEASGVTPVDLSIYRDLEGLYTSLGTDLIAREMDLTGSKYEFKQYAYNEISDRVKTPEDYEEFLNEVIEKEPAGTWTQIDSAKTDADGYPIFSITGTPNTTYVVLFRAYRDVPPTGTKVAFPTYIIEATLPTGKDIIITPTVPKLILVEGSITDTSAKVKWESNKLLEYELAFSDVYNDPEKGVQISIANVKENSETKTETQTEIDFIHMPIDGLFPDTVYNVWIRAVNLDGSLKSSWSNYLTFKTSDMPVPSPPRGLGIASTYDLEVVNANLGTKHERVTKDSFIVAWLKNDKDKADNTTGATTEDNTVRIEDESLTDIFLAQFNARLPNKEYYVRAKTIATVAKGDGDRANKTYSYVVQVSPTPEFEEYVQIIVPATVVNADANGSTKYFKQKESDWTTTIRVKTSTTNDEYDGAADAAFYPLQNEDFEIVYNPAANSVTFRFRVDGTDSAGNHDNRVDQRFISNLVTSKAYSYNLDLSQNSYSTKTVEMPYSIVKALDERKVDLKFKSTSTTIVTIPYGAIAGSAVKGMQGLSDTTKISITVTNSTTAPTLNETENYVIYPYKISVKAVSPKQTVNLTDTLKPMTLEMKSQKVEGTYDRNTGIYMTPSSSDEWQRINTTYDTTTAEYKATASKLGIYSIIAANIPEVRGSNDAEMDAAYEFSSSMTIANTSTINTNASVTGNVYNNIMLSLLDNKSSVDIDSAVSTSDLQKLSKAGLGVSADANTEVTREEAISALVTLYEKKTGSRIKYYNTIDETPYEDIRNASPRYQTALLKAAEIGFYTNDSVSMPSIPLRYGDLMYMINIIKSNAR